MKKILLLVVAYLGGWVSAYAADKPFNVLIIPEKRSERDSYISWGSGSVPAFFVLLTNLTDKPQPVFERWNSWGYQTIAFEMILSDGQKANLAVKERVFTKNAPSVYVIPPHGHQVFPITLGDEWLGKPNLGPAGTTKVMLKAVYEIVPTKESREQGAWTGRIESTPAEVYVRHW